METRVEELGLAERFRFAGWVERIESPRYINAMDMVVMPSEMEARSLVYLETQACGRVLIASDIAAAREVIEDGVTGLLFPMGSPEALAAKILEASADPELRERIGANARMQAEACSMKSWLDAYETALAGLICEARPA
jgi:glycosyltransferase involved in cell wall biosynthesis